MKRRGYGLVSSGRQSLFDLVLGAEVAAARIEAALMMDPMLAAQWRAEVGVGEAVASIGLEDVRVAEPDLLIRISENTAHGIEARATEDALAVMRVLRAPGDVAGRPEDVLDRIDRLSMRAQPGTEHVRGADLPGLFAPCVGRSPILEAIRVASDYAWRTDRRSPVAERLVFMAAEHASRTRGRRPGMAAEHTLRGLGGRFDADWICPPSLALTRLRFRIWSPSNPAMLRDLLTGIETVLVQELGRLISLRRWRERLDESSRGRHGRSRLGDAGRAFGIEPSMTSAILADRIGVTQRGALNILSQMVEEGLIVEMTRRRSARIWATPGLAQLLSPPNRARAGHLEAPTSGVLGSLPPAIREDGRILPEAGRRQKPLRPESEAAISAALAEFDSVLDSVDEILGRHRPPVDDERDATFR